MTSAFTRGACPRLSEPMQTGDGLLARMILAGPIPLDVFTHLCAAAREHGNGVMEVSLRGSLQVRGLTPVSAPLFAATVASLHIPVCEGVPVIASPLADDPAALIDADALTVGVRRAIAATAVELAPKVSVMVDDAGSLHLDALGADIRLRAVSTASGPMMHVALAGNAASAVPLGVVASGQAAEVVTELLAAISALGSGSRAADLLNTVGTSAVRSALRACVEPAAPLSARPPAQPIALHRMRDGTCVIGLGLAFGHTQADALIVLAEIAGANGGRWTRPAPDRSLLLGPLSETSTVAVRKAAEQLGFLIDPRDPRRRVIACPGAPSCASGLIAARAIAAEIAGRLPPALSLVHVSGCAKGCAHPARAPLTVVGTSEGCGVIRDGAAREVPEAHVFVDELPAALARLTEPREAVDA
ncbi:MAG: precorrin-3B synthase [Actinomycetota bacterium]